MLDIKFIKEKPALIRKDLEKRGDKEKAAWVGELIEKHELWKKLKDENDRLRNSRNIITREINELRKQGRDITAKIKEAKELHAKIEESDKTLQQLKERTDFILQRLPNILHSSVPAGKDAEDNKEARKWGRPKKTKEAKSHGELLEEKGLADFSR